MSTYLILMTACIDPGNAPIKVARHDPVLRLADYRNALIFWLHLHDSRITKLVFVENSGYCLDELTALAQRENIYGRKIEFLSLNCNQYPSGIHYGYAELQMIDEALVRSSLLSTSEYFIKATGRLIFPNICRLVDRLPEQFLFSVDARRNSLLVKKNQEFITTQLMVFSTQFYSLILAGCKSEMGGIYKKIERLLYHKLISYEGQPGAILRWPVSIDPVGFAANFEGKSKNYSSSRQFIINQLRSFCRIVLPKWWV